MLIRRPLLSPRLLLEQESRASIAVTVAWMLTILATTGSLIAAGICVLLRRSVELAPEPAKVLAILPGVFTFIAATTGIACLLLTVVVYRVRRDRPPTSITFVAVLVGLLPIATMLLRAMRG
ncbi:hypothetical protein NA78x_002967 [Anatilimnocola sp. NA78]|uniref:hypothetical protein n=1 Tax=Anatilimnocola sp. NA78 TaxID=3415683 RepID=UPI003CE58E85